MHPCPLCNTRFGQVAELGPHIRKVHRGCNNIICIDKSCKRVLTNASGYLRHWSRCHAQEKTSPNVEVQCDLEEEVQNTENERIPAALCESNNVESINSSLGRLSKQSDALVAKLYSYAGIPRSVVSNIIKDFDVYNTNVLGVIRRVHDSSEDCKSDTNNILDAIGNTFRSHRTEHATMQKFAETSFVRPITCKVGRCLMSKRDRTGKRRLMYGLLTIQVIPMKEVLTRFLELPGILTRLLAEVNAAHDGNIKYSILDGDRWKQVRARYGTKLVLPVTLYFDDFEINNPLGSRKGRSKMGAMYFTISCIPSEFGSLLENIFLMQVHNSNLMKVCTVAKLFANVIKQMQDLEKYGVTVRVEGKRRQIHFVLLNMVGDNLGLHSLLGFTESFNSTYTCRVCTVEKKLLHKLTTEMPSLLRNNVEHSSHAAYKTMGCGVAARSQKSQILTYSKALTSILCMISWKAYAGTKLEKSYITSFLDENTYLFPL